MVDWKLTSQALMPVVFIEDFSFLVILLPPPPLLRMKKYNIRILLLRV